MYRGAARQVTVKTNSMYKRLMKLEITVIGVKVMQEDRSRLPFYMTVDRFLADIVS